jgi:hypothetical protein
MRIDQHRTCALGAGLMDRTAVHAALLFPLSEVADEPLAELTMARIAVLSAAGSFSQALTTCASS